MGMICCFAAADSATFNALRAEPEKMEAFLYPSDVEGDVGEPLHRSGASLPR
jgi:hypothetical protein